MISSDIRVEFEAFRNAGLNGDDMAATRLESRFGDSLARFVRRVVRTGRGSGSLAEFVLKEAQVVREQLGLERDALVAELTSRICSVITGQGIAGKVDTVSVADRQTVFAS
jgi:hypothetical protein